MKSERPDEGNEYTKGVERGECETQNEILQMRWERSSREMMKRRSNKEKDIFRGEENYQQLWEQDKQNQKFRETRRVVIINHLPCIIHVYNSCRSVGPNHLQFRAHQAFPVTDKPDDSDETV